MVRAILGALASTCLMGCQSVTFQGRVVEGPASVVVPVDAGDPRLGPTATPVEGASVTVRARRADGPVLAATTADAQGRFRVRLSNPAQARGELALSAAADGRLPARSVLFLPEPGRQVLIVLEPVGKAEGSAATVPTNR